MSLTQARLKELLDYNPETGLVTRLVCTANRHKVGEIVGAKGARGYLQATINSKKYMLHRLIWLWVHGVWPANDVDHRDRNRANNKLGNLREATRSENNHNSSLSKANWSGFKGVAWDKSRSLWMASIQANGESHHLGRFATAALASVAYQAAKNIYHPTAPVAQQGA